MAIKDFIKNLFQNDQNFQNSDPATKINILEQNVPEMKSLPMEGKVKVLNGFAEKYSVASNPGQFFNNITKNVGQGLQQVPQSVGGFLQQIPDTASNIIDNPSLVTKIPDALLNGFQGGLYGLAEGTVNLPGDIINAGMNKDIIPNLHIPTLDESGKFIANNLNNALGRKSIFQNNPDIIKYEAQRQQDINKLPAFQTAGSFVLPAGAGAARGLEATNLTDRLAKSALTGAGFGAVATPGTLKERVSGAGTGALFGAGGHVIGYGAGKIAPKKVGAKVVKKSSGFDALRQLREQEAIDAQRQNMANVLNQYVQKQKVSLVKKPVNQQINIPSENTVSNIIIKSSAGKNPTSERWAKTYAKQQKLDLSKGDIKQVGEEWHYISKGEPLTAKADYTRFGTKFDDYLQPEYKEGLKQVKLQIKKKAETSNIETKQQTDAVKPKADYTKQEKSFDYYNTKDYQEGLKNLNKKYKAEEKTSSKKNAQTPKKQASLTKKGKENGQEKGQGLLDQPSNESKKEINNNSLEVLNEQVNLGTTGRGHQYDVSNIENAKINEVKPVYDTLQQAIKEGKEVSWKGTPKTSTGQPTLKDKQGGRLFDPLGFATNKDGDVRVFGNVKLADGTFEQRSYRLDTIDSVNITKSRQIDTKRIVNEFGEKGYTNAYRGVKIVELRDTVSKNTGVSIEKIINQSYSKSDFKKIQEFWRKNDKKWKELAEMFDCYE